MALIEYSEEQALLARAAHEFAAKTCTFAKVREWMSSEAGYDPAVYERMVGLGWPLAALPETLGGAGAGAAALVGVHEACGRRLLAGPLLATTLAAEILARCEVPAARAAVASVIRGEVASLALFEPDGSWEVESPGSEAVLEGDGYRLSGTKVGVLDAAEAGHLVVSASISGEPALFLVGREAQMAERLRRESMIDQTRRTYRVSLDGLRVPQEARLTKGAAEGRRALAFAARLGALYVAAEMVGVAEGSMQLTLEYLRTRKQFGKLIGSYQALKHPMVEIMIQIEQARSLLYHAATLIGGSDDREAEIACRMVKAYAGETVAYAVDRSIQFHGAIGFTYECSAQLFFRRAQWGVYAFGDGRHHRRRLADLFLKQ